MIREHAFNTAHWGAPVGVIADEAFFRESKASKERWLAPYAWVEFRAPLLTAPPLEVLASAGFVQVDTQVPFRVGLAKVPAAPTSPLLDVHPASARPFEVRVGDFTSFGLERYRHLPGMTIERLDERYARWARQLVRDDPAWCLELSLDEQVTGWFLSTMRADRTLNLTLAMNRRAGPGSGWSLYQRALSFYATQGARVGWASFSVGNADVLNLYARLGAHFLPPLGCWLWWPKPSDVASSERA